MGRIGSESAALLTIPTLVASYHPLFSAATTSLVLILLYVPRPFLFSPALIGTLLLLLLLTVLLRSSPPYQQPLLLQEPPATDSGPKPLLCSDIAKWGRRSGPLEVIYEEYEGEDDDDDVSSDTGSSANDCQRWVSSPVGSFCFPWEDDDDDTDDDDGMIEIRLEEENLIEIDISCGYCR